MRKHCATQPEDDLKLPDADLHLFEKIVAYDHLSNKAVIILNINKSDDLETKYKECEKICNEVVETLRNYKPVMKTPKTMEDNITVKSNITKEHYLANVEKAKKYIKEGDIFQIVPSQRFEIDNPPDSFDVYECSAPLIRHLTFTTLSTMIMLLQALHLKCLYQ